MNVSKILIWSLIKLQSFYKIFVTPLLGPRCRYYPSCSDYFVDALKKKGFFKGFIVGVFRILRCNPLFKGGIDELK